MKNYWWLGGMNDIEKYVDGCDLCQKMKNCIEALGEKLIVNKMLKKL